MAGTDTISSMMESAIKRGVGDTNILILQLIFPIFLACALIHL